MATDKEFSKKRQDKTFDKEKKPDRQLGHHTEYPKSEPTSHSQKNRKYQVFQQKNEEFENKSTSPDVTPEEKVTPYTVEENHTQEEIQEEFMENSESFSESVKPYDTNTSQPKSASQKNHYYRKHYQKTDVPKPDIPTVDEPSEVHKPTDTNDKTEVKSEPEHKTNIDSGSHSSQNDNFEFSSKDEDGSFVRNDYEFSSDDSSKETAETKSESKGQKKKTKKKSTYENTKKSDASSKTTDSDEKVESPKGSSKEFSKYEKAQSKADKAKKKVQKAQDNLPHKRKLQKKRIYDEEKQKAKTKLVFEKQVQKRPESSRLQFAEKPLSFLGYEATNKLHSKISSVEKDNSAVEATHKVENAVENFALQTAHSYKMHKKYSPYQKVEKLQHKADKLEAKAHVKKFFAENPEMKKKSAINKAYQKRKIKKQYQKAKQAEHRAKKTKKALQETKRTMSRIASFVWRNKGVIIVILLIGLLLFLFMNLLSSCSIMGTTGANSLMVSSYFADDDDIYAAENYYVSLEQNLQNRINNIESEYSGYDEYNYNVAGIGHNPYELISYLTAVHYDFKFNDIKSALDSLFNEQYHLRITQRSEQRTDSEGNTYTYKILNVTLTNSGFTTSMNADQRELYCIYLASKGNRDYLFADDIYSNITQSPYEDYTIPGEALNDATFRRLITEAERYLGYPYVWGGSSPSTSFDCSGFVCWVYKNSGVYPLSRTTAQGIFNQCSPVRPSEAKPGDIIFFTGTYNSGCPVSHVGIYVGNGMMIHCGNPIQYANVNSSYWSSHFYAYGRLGNNN